ncbi:Gfo/Idh/MocA family oxidoreductase [Sutcliffiella horikoshii]|uniref:Gfo/Idh/MocA family oxidoreductase n=2 Tax=Sutcliffiella horikoshii TaxID=79883 RepID=A0A5D4SQZ6_9BACI|nr:Gfo/Idh/MocA family oxidoreductase [Sutcliffiella horikoshii]
MIAMKHMKAIGELAEDIQLVALCDINIENMRNILMHWHSPSDIKLFTEVNLFLKSDVDLVVIATSTDSHFSITKLALEKNKHVVVEKPLSLSIDEARELHQMAEETNNIVAVSLQTRYLSQIQAIVKAKQEGRFGKLYYGTVTVRWNRSNEYYAKSLWRGTWEKDGGVLLNQCIHYIDLLQLFFGDVVSVYGVGGTFRHPIEAEDLGTALLKFANGSVGIIEGTTTVYDKNLQTSLSLFGENGYVSLEGERLNDFKYWRFKDENENDLEIRTKIEEISHTKMYKDIVSAIRSGSKPYVSIESTLKTHEIIFAIYKSIQTGSTVNLPLDRFSTKDNVDS